MAKAKPANAPSTTGKPSGSGRGNNPPAPGKQAPPAPKASPQTGGKKPGP